MGSTQQIAARAAGLALFLCASVARADDTALELSKQGYELFLANKCNEAIPVLVRSAELEPDPRTYVNLARCEDKVASLVAARGHLERAREIAREKGATEMVAQLDTMIAELDKRVPHVGFELDPDAPAGTTVRHGSEEIRPGAIAVDPGPQSFVVTAPNRADRPLTFTLAEGETKTFVALPGPPLVTAPPLVTTPPPPAAPAGGSPLRTVAVITMIAGGAGLALGGVFGAIALGRKHDADDAGCRDQVCPDAPAGALRDDAKAAGTIATIAFVAGGVVAAGGFGLFLFSPSASPDRVGLTVSGRF